MKQSTQHVRRDSKELSNIKGAVLSGTLLWFAESKILRNLADLALPSDLFFLLIIGFAVYSMKYIKRI